jgi:hypothetical protein
MQQCAPSRTSRAILLLYSLADLRAQGLLQKKNFFRLAFLCIAGAICSFTLYQVATAAINHYPGPHATILVVISLSALLLFVINALSVGAISGTSGLEELRALQYFPLTVPDIVRTRIALGIFRSELVALVFFLPPCVAAIVHVGWSPFLILGSLSILLTFPLVPATLGIALNLREARTNLLVWLYTFIGLLAIGTFLSQQYPIFPAPLGWLAGCITLPVRGLLAQAPPYKTLIFGGGWTALAFSALGVILQGVKTVPGKTMRGGSALCVPLMRLILRLPGKQLWSDLASLSGLAIMRLPLLLIFASIVSLALFMNIVLQLVPANIMGDTQLTALTDAMSLTGQCSVGIILCFGPLMASLLGNAQDHRVLQQYPFSIRIHLGAIYLILLLIGVPLITSLALIATFISHVSLLLWFGMYMFSSLLGGGSLLLVVLLGRRPSIKLIGWGLLGLLYGVVKELSLCACALVLRINPFFAAGLSNLIMDSIVFGVCWRWVIIRQYKRFLEEDL